MADKDDRPDFAEDPELVRIVEAEEKCLERIECHLARRAGRKLTATTQEYDAAMVDLRDQIAVARLEDVPPLLEQMERLQSLANWRRTAALEGTVDPKSPYFAHLVLAEGERRRDVLIGRSTYVDTDSGVRIVDWREAPVSRLYYRYQEGDAYEEVFGGREVHGEIVARRSVTISEAELRRVVAPQGSFVRGRTGQWRRLAAGTGRLSGGQGVAVRPEYRRPGRLGVGDQAYTEDKHLKEITSLIDPHQFELITRPDSGVVVIQGGAGSGKTTIALHRLAYLAYLDRRRFRLDRMLVLVYNDSLCRFISLVLPALGVEGVSIQTYAEWAADLRRSHFPELPAGYSQDTPPEVIRVKKHPGLLRAVEMWAAHLESQLGDTLAEIVQGQHDSSSASALVSVWRSSAGRPTSQRLHALASALHQAANLSTNVRVATERLCRTGLRDASDVVRAWAEILGDVRALGASLAARDGELTPELARALTRIARDSSDILLDVDEAREQNSSESRHHGVADATDEPPEVASEELEDEGTDSPQGVDGRELEEASKLDREDDTLLLRLYQRLVGPLLRTVKGKEPLTYEHLVIDEAQDLSPLEIATALGTVSNGQSITLAGDLAQRLNPDNGFTDWETLLSDLRLKHVALEPLRISYRSTREIIQFAHHVLGPLAPEAPGLVTRTGAPVEVLEFGHAGESANFLAEALRELMQAEPLASVAVIARYPEQADLYYEALQASEVPRLRRIAEQDFSFRPGVDVTDVRQVKGLEFDYVVLIEVSEASYPDHAESRYLLHIAATRAAHQLWVLSTGHPSPLVAHNSETPP